MGLIKITDLSAQLGLSSRSLRSYEEVGLIASVRVKFEKYRYYDETAIERLRQIMVLRKMQIPIKDIIRIFENPEIETIVDVFVDKIGRINTEVTALSELKEIINTFLQKMIECGIKKISALPLLYEEMDKQLEIRESLKTVTYEELDKIGDRLRKDIRPIILSLPKMRMLSSVRKDHPNESDCDGFWRFVQLRKIPIGSPGLHEAFEYSSEHGTVVMIRIPDKLPNDSDYQDFVFQAGLFAAIHVYVDEDLDEWFHFLVQSFQDHPFYQIAYSADGDLRQPAMLENLISPDETRQLVALLVPVKKRLADPVLYEGFTEISPDAISPEQIEAENPSVWEVDVPLDKLIPINSPYYRVSDNGEAEYTGWISTRVLSTDVAVKLPYRVDMECRVDIGSARYGYYTPEGGLCFYHGENLSYPFSVNDGNRPDDSKEQICFHQPVFNDRYCFPRIGRIEENRYNRVTWIVGATHLAVIINGEVRFCGKNFPYMKLDLNTTETKPILIGSDGQAIKYIRKIRVSQLLYHPQNKLKGQELKMTAKRSNHSLSNIHRLITSEHGENYWFNGCARYVMECLGEREYDYTFFAGLTGDHFVWHYKFGYPGDGVNSYAVAACDSAYFEEIFQRCGYASTVVSGCEVQKNRDLYRGAIVSYIDKGVPVIVLSSDMIGVIVGYEEYGETLLFITGDCGEPTKRSLNETITGGRSMLIFVGEKQENKPLAQLYREAIFALPELLMTNDENRCFGAAAFRKWADDVEGGLFDRIRPDEYKEWDMYTNFVCVLATNSGGCRGFLAKAQELNPDLSVLKEVGTLYERTGGIWNELEALGGGFNVTLKTLQDPERREKIAAKLRECAEVADRITDLLTACRGTV